MADAVRHFDEERVFVTFYGLTLLTIRLLGAALTRTPGARSSTQPALPTRSY